MITGSVNQRKEAIISVLVQGPTARETSFDCVIDTGFDGWLTLPSEAIDKLELNWKSRGRAQLADGTEIIFDVYDAVVFWDGSQRRVAIDCADVEPLVGMALLEGSELTVQIRANGLVTIKSLLGSS